MEIRCILLQKEQQKRLIQCGWIPNDLEIVLNEQTLFFGSLDEENHLRAIAVFSFSKSNLRDVKLEYIFVQKQCRRQGIGVKLLHFSEEQLQLLGTRRLLCEWHDSEANMEIVSAYLKKAGYLPTIKPAHMLVYKQGQFQGSELEKLKDAEPKIWKSVVRIEDYHDWHLKKLLAKRETTGFYIEESDYRPELCRFYIEEGEIKGAACMRFMKDGSLTTMKGYLAPTLKCKYAMTLLIARLIQDLGTVLTPGIKIYLKIYRKKFYESAKKNFGEGQEEYLLQEYERMIGGR